MKILFLMLTLCLSLTQCTVLPEAEKARAVTLTKSLEGGAAFHFQGKDGVRLSGFRHRAKGKPRHILIALHGFQTHAAWMTPLARQLNEQGVEVWCPDRRGSGLNVKSPNASGSIDRWETWVDDLDALVAEVKRGADGVPVSLLGYSWGGCIVTAYQQLRPDCGIHRNIVVAPGYASRKPGFPVKQLLLGASRVLPGVWLPLPVPKDTSKPYSRHALLQDPLRLASTKLSYLRQMHKMQQHIMANMSRAPAGMYVQLAKEDHLIHNEKVSAALEPRTPHLVWLEGATHLLVVESVGEVSRFVLGSIYE